MPLAVELCQQISIHASRVGSDHELLQLMEKYDVFQSTLPAWEATRW